MANWFAIFETATGTLRGEGTVIPSDADLTARGLSKLLILFGDPRRPDKEWNPTTTSYDDIVPPREPLEKQDFIERFTDQEREDLFDMAINGTAAQKRKIKAFIDFMKLIEHVHLDNAYIVTSVNLMESNGVIGPGRAAQVLA